MTTANKQAHCRNIGLPSLNQYCREEEKKRKKETEEKKEREKKRERKERTDEKSAMFINIYIKPFGSLSESPPLSLSHTHTHMYSHAVFIPFLLILLSCFHFTISGCISAWMADEVRDGYEEKNARGCNFAQIFITGLEVLCQKNSLVITGLEVPHC